MWPHRYLHHAVLNYLEIIWVDSSIKIYNRSTYHYLWKKISNDFTAHCFHFAKVNYLPVTCIYMYNIIFNLHSVVWQRLSHHIRFFFVNVFCYRGSMGLAFLGFDEFGQFVGYLTSHHSIVFNEADIFQSLGYKWFTNNITHVNNQNQY